MPDGTGLLVPDEEAMRAFGGRLAAKLRPGDVIGLSGGLGAGKTTLARGLLFALGLNGEAPSPSFAIVQPYEPPIVRMAVAHVDLYRLEDAAEAEELGLDDYLEEGALVVEWPERLGDAFWSHGLLLTILTEANGARRLTAKAPDAWKERWLQL